MTTWRLQRSGVMMYVSVVCSVVAFSLKVSMGVSGSSVHLKILELLVVVESIVTEFCAQLQHLYTFYLRYI